MASASDIDYLTSALLHEKRPVTYKLLARKQCINVNTAKQILWQFLQDQQPNVHAIYCLTGKLITDESDSSCHTIRLVKSKDLEAAKRGFRQLVGVHVYALVPYEPESLTVVVVANKDIPRLAPEDQAKCGALVSPATDQGTKTEDTVQPSAALGKRKDTDAQEEQPKKKVVSTATNKAVEKPQPPVTQSTKTAKTAPKPSVPTKSKTMARKNTTIAKKATTSSDVKAAAPTHTMTKMAVSDIFSDDEESEKKVEQDERDETMTEEIVAETTVDDTKDNTTGAEPDTETEKQASDDTAEPAPPGKVRRRVLKKKQYTNERGFLVTEDVWEWELVDADIPSTDSVSVGTTKQTPKTPNFAKPTASSMAKSPAKKPANKAGQSNLLNFWKKK